LLVTGRSRHERFSAGKWLLNLDISQRGQPQPRNFSGKKKLTENGIAAVAVTLVGADFPGKEASGG